MGLPKNNRLLENARKLRKDMTPQERKLWYLFLRSYPVKFYKQRIIGSYIADFYCAAGKLVIEIDGSQHYDDEQKAYDCARTAYLNKLDLNILRFSNADINERFSQVCDAIHQYLQESIP